MRTLLGFLLLLSLFSFRQMDNNIPFFRQSLVLNDTSISNNTDLKIYCLFDNRDSANHVIKSCHNFEREVRVCDNGNLVIHYGPTDFIVQPTGVEVQTKGDTICGREIISHCFETHRVVKDLKNGSVDIYYDTKKRHFKTQVGQIEVAPTQFGCDDTGQNPMKISRNGKTILFKDIGNLIFFEHDIDKDGKKELYVLDYFSCMGDLKIYKIDDK
jgi:hypothetical protein